MLYEHRIFDNSSFTRTDARTCIVQGNRWCGGCTVHDAVRVVRWGQPQPLVRWDSPLSARCRSNLVHRLLDRLLLLSALSSFCHTEPWTFYYGAFA